MASLRPRLRRTAPPPPDSFLASMLESLPDPAVACNADGTVIIANRAARAIFSIPVGAVTVGEWANPFELRARGQLEELRTEELPLLRALRGEDVGMEIESTAQDGTTRLVSVSGGPVRGSDGTITGAVVVIRDVTAGAAEELRLGLEDSILASVRQGVVLVSASDGEIVYANRAWWRMFGYLPGELIGRHISVVNAPADQTPEDRAGDIIGALNRSGAWSGDIHNVRKDGTQFWSHATVTTFDHRRYGPLWVAVHSDVTRVKAADEAMRESEERFRAVFEQSPVGMALVSDGLRVIDVNRAFCGITGYRREELQGRPLTEISHPSDVALDSELFGQVFSGATPPHRVAKRYMTKRGDVVTVILTVGVMASPDGGAPYGIAIVEPPDSG